MALILTEPFDNFTAAPWVVTSTPAIVAGRTGTAAEINSISDRITYSIPAPSQTDTVTIGFAYRTPVIQASHIIFSFYSDTNATQHTGLSALADGRLFVNRAGTSLVQSAAGVLVANTWQYIEATFKLHDTTGTATVRVNGAVVINATALDTKNAGTKAVYDALRLSTPSATTGGIGQFDDLYLRNDNVFQGDPTLTVPDQPTPLTATQTGPQTVRLTWPAPADGGSAITGYLIQRDGATLATVTALTYDDATAVGPATYSYTVAAINAVGTGPWAGATIIIPDPTPPPGPPELLSGSIVFVRDQAQLLNVATVTNNEPTPQSVTAEDPFSIARFGRRTEAFGFPQIGLAFAYAADAQANMNRAVSRFGYITRHVEEIIADTDVDPNWLPVLAELDTGRPLTIHRREILPLTLDGVVVGYSHIITPGRISTTISTTTITAT